MEGEWVRVFLGAVVLGGIGSTLAAQPPGLVVRNLRVDSLQTTVLNLPQGRIASLRIGPSGDIYLWSSDVGSIYRLGPDGDVEAVFELSQITDSLGMGAQPRPTFAVGPGESVHVPLMWRPSPDNARDTRAGLAVFSPAGPYEQWVALKPSVEVRHIAVDALGNFYVLGMDPAYFRQETDSCNLIHKYSPDGRHLASFSPCPQPEPVRGERMQIGPGFRRLQAEADRGQVWLAGPNVYHLLPLSRALRIFEADGEVVRVVTLEPPWLELGPPGLAVEIWIWSLGILPDGSHVVEWLRSEQDGSRVMNSRHRTVHDSQGRLVSSPQPVRASTGTLLFSDNRGDCYFLTREETGRILLQRSRLSVQ